MKSPIWICSATFLTGLLWATILCGWQPPEVTLRELPNGFKIVSLPNRELPLFKAKLFVKTGKAYERAGREGLASLTTSLLVSGGTWGKTPDELDLWLDQEAVELNADTGYESTSITIQSLAEKSEEALRLLFDVALRPRFDPKRFKITRLRMLDALRREEDLPDPTASKALRREVFGGTPWAKIATTKSLGAIKRKELVRFHAAHWSPERMWLALAGDFKIDRLSPIIDQVGLLPKGTPSEIAWAELPFAIAPSTKRISMELTQSFIKAGHRGLKRGGPDEYAYTLLQFILGGSGFTSRLGSDIRTERGLAYSVYTDWNVTPARGLFSIHVETRTQNEEEVLKIIDMHLRRLKEKADITPQELAYAKESLVNQYIFWFKSPLSVPGLVAQLDLLGYQRDYLKKYPERIGAVGLEEVRAAAKKYLNPDGLKIVIVGPKKSTAKK